MSGTSPDTLRQEIWQLLANGDQAAILKAAELIRSLPPPGKEPDELTAQCIFDTGFGIESLGEDDFAIQLYQLVLDYPVVDTKYTASAWFRIGVCTCRQGNMAEAVHCYRESLRLARGQPHLTALARFYLAGLLEAGEDYREAAELYGELLPMLPHPDINSHRAHLRYARCSLRVGREEIAIAELTALTSNSHEPESAEAWQILAEIAEKKKDYVEAQRAYREIVASPNAENNLRMAAAYRLVAIPQESRRKSRS